MPLLDKYAPKAFTDLVFEDPNSQNYLAAYVGGQVDDNVILHGPNGTGKSKIATVVVQAVADKATLFLGAPKIIEGGDWKKSSIDEIEHYWRYQSTSAVTPVVLINELDRIGITEQYRLQALYDRLSFGRFFATTNHLHIIDRSLRSRSREILIDLPRPQAFAPRAMAILSAEGLDLSLEQVTRVLEATDGSFRDYSRSLDEVLFVHHQLHAGAANPTAPPIETWDAKRAGHTDGKCNRIEPGRTR